MGARRLGRALQRIQTLVPLVNSVAKSAAQGVQQAVNQQFAAMLQQQQEMLVALQRIADRAPLPGPVSPTVATPSTQASGGAENVATTPSSSTGSGSPVGMPPASAIMSVPLITQPTRPLTVPSLTLLQGTGAGSASTSIVAATQNPIPSVAVTDRGGTKEERPVLLASSTPPVPQKIAERIWRGQFVAMWELLPEALAGGSKMHRGEERQKEGPKNPKHCVVDAGVECLCGGNGEETPRTGTRFGSIHGPDSSGQQAVQGQSVGGI